MTNGDFKTEYFDNGSEKGQEKIGEGKEFNYKDYIIPSEYKLIGQKRSN